MLCNEATGPKLYDIRLLPASRQKALRCIKDLDAQIHSANDLRSAVVMILDQAKDWPFVRPHFLLSWLVGKQRHELALLVL